MGNSLEIEPTDRRIADSLRTLRAERGWSLDALARQTGVSRATLSRLENAEVSPTAAVLGKLCAAYGLTLSRLMLLAEGDFTPLIARDEQTVWLDPETGFRRRLVSPPAQMLAGEAIEGEIPPATRLSYDAPPRPSLEHHLVMLDGRLTLTVDGATYALSPGDCLRYRLLGPSSFETPAETGARYLLFLV
ncbi:helix-turn-helix domain-containing protein [Amorphus sp. 3PC139-8]|uniref:helix-turn-helix domain-containing protein n=1 Tax=Amorphus sp. 3PC139-8 TaxID=2735676 RepID=UPI00345DEC20